MENPATWNSTVKVLNKYLHFTSTKQDMLNVLIDNNLLLCDIKDSRVSDVLDAVIKQQEWENKNIACGLSLGRKIYDKLSVLNLIKYV